MNSSRFKKWVKRGALTAAALVLFLIFVVFPIGASFLITNARFRFPERNARTPDELGLPVTPIEFATEDDIRLRGWWNAGEESSPVIIFSHGLNRSRVEMLERAAEARRRGYGVLLFDSRNHGESDSAYTTLGVRESQDVCAASRFVREREPDRRQLLWGVSLGAATALLAAPKCPGFAGIVADSSFLSFRETIAHHISLIFRIPSFPIANLIVAITAWRMGFDPDEGDVESAVRRLANVPILFVAGGRDARMPPALAERLYRASPDPLREMLVIPEAGHGNAFTTDRQRYLDAVFGFFVRIGVSKGAS
jgi:pimeloyl-ACP methyl ester carboxylesterase